MFAVIVLAAMVIWVTMIRERFSGRSDTFIDGIFVGLTALIIFNYLGWL